MGIGDARIRWRGKAPSDTLRSNLRSMCKKEKSMMEVKCLVLGMIRTNCYIIYTDDTKKAVIIDPAADAKKIIREISEKYGSACYFEGTLHYTFPTVDSLNEAGIDGILFTDNASLKAALDGYFETADIPF